MDRIARRYAPLSRDHIPGFLNKIPKVDWSRNLPTFKDDGKKDAALHLVRFHMHIRKLKVDFPEDCLMKIFLATLEGEAQSWYDNLPQACIYCLKDFHALFIERYQASYPSLNLVHDCCKHASTLIESLEKYYEDDNFMDVEIMEVLYENPFQQHKEKLENSHQDDHDIFQQNQDQQVEDNMAENDERENDISDLPTEDSSMQVSPVLIVDCDNVQSATPGSVEIIWNVEDTVIHTVSPSLEHDLHEEAIQSVHEQQGEIFVQVSDESHFNNLVINDSLSALSYGDNYYLSKRKQKALSPLSEEEIHQLLKGLVTAQATADLQCTHSQESVGKDDCLVDQQIDNVFLHKYDNPTVITFEDDLPYFQTTEDQSIQDYLSDSSYVSCAEMFFQEEIRSSICSEFFEAYEHTFTEAHDEGRSEFEAKDTLFFQQEVAVEKLHVFQDPMAALLQSAVKVIIAVFSDEREYGRLCFWMPNDRFVLLTRSSDRKNQSRSHLLDWLHWHLDIV